MSAAESTVAAEPIEIVKGFFEALTVGEIDAAMELMTADAVWVNVTLPTVRGRSRIERALRRLLGPSAFRAHFHAIAQHGETVLTERTDELAIGPFKQRFWVYGRFELREGRIAVWRDSFDWLDLIVSAARGVAGIFAPGLNRRWPAS